jgi:nucleoside 2-deoxyribosyltransferase
MGKAPCRKLYLAGGFKSGWQAEVHAVLIGYDILDPSKHNIQDPKSFTDWDLTAIRQSDIVLANMEATNPGGYSLALEIGYARALGKSIIFVEQIADPKIRYYFEMIRQCSDAVFHNLCDALDFLNNID